MAVSSANEESHLAPSTIPPAFERPRKLHRRQRITPLVEDDTYRSGTPFGQLAATLGQLGHSRRPGNALQIALDKIGFRRSADLSAGDDVEQHLLC
jgi:hypothetical protein